MQCKKLEVKILRNYKISSFREKKPLLGICVGMQILGSSSAEGVEKGLNLIDGKIKKS